jgi:hypothetical protein
MAPSESCLRCKFSCHLLSTEANPDVVTCECLVQTIYFTIHIPLTYYLCLLEAVQFLVSHCILELESIMDTLTYYLCLFLSLLPLLLLKLIKRDNNGLRLPPGPWRLPVIGSLHHLLGSPLPHHAMADIARQLKAPLISTSSSGKFPSSSRRPRTPLARS